VDVASLESVAKQVVHPTLFRHKDRGVKAYTACCVADILRLYAPNKVHSEQELKVHTDVDVVM
jgi:sister-chromatid-cohesion protein PDS5